MTLAKIIASNETSVLMFRETESWWNVRQQLNVITLILLHIHYLDNLNQTNNNKKAKKIHITWLSMATHET